MRSKDTAQQATEFLLHDFIWVLKRTQRLYVKFPTWKSIWPESWKQMGRPHGFFEPALLCLSWCDFLGALYNGGGGSKARSVAWFESAHMTDQNKRYKEFAKPLYIIHRCALAHAYQPPAFTLNFSPNTRHFHLTWGHKAKGHFEVHIPCLIEDVLRAVESYANGIRTTKSGPGSLDYYRQGWKYIEGEYQDGLQEILTGKRPKQKKKKKGKK